MANALGTLFQDIANAIRSKTNDTATMKPSEFPEKISSIEAGGENTTKVNFYGMTFANMQYTIVDSPTVMSGPGNMVGIAVNTISTTVDNILAIPDDGYEYSIGCTWDWLGGRWIYDYRIHTNETFEVPYSGTLQSYSAPSCLTFVSDSGSSLKFRGSSSEGNGNLQVNTSAYNNSYKIIVG